jgi:hypothetical protein
LSTCLMRNELMLVARANCVRGKNQKVSYMNVDA